MRARFKFLLAELFPASWMEKHPDYWRSFEFPREMSSPVSIMRQNRAYEEWQGVCSRLAEIKVPVLVVTGTEDSSTPPENSLMLAERIPQSWLVRFGCAGHGLQYQYPEELARVITGFQVRWLERAWAAVICTSKARVGSARFFY